jgi:NAD(P)-dependent dehydrogenase (short-subunit alcohol dehydrogenase family)
VKSILVTGAASGIGYATAERFVREGWFVGVGDIDGDAMGRALDTLGTDNIMGLHFDVRDAAQFKKAVRAFAEQAGQLDVLVNNAGVCDMGFFEDVPEESTRRIVDVNLMGVINGTYAAIPHLERRGGTIVNMASLSAAYGIPHLAVYSATKHAVVGLSQALDLELARKGIRVVAVCPPFVETPILDSPRHTAGLPPIPARRLPPSQVADEVWRAVEGGGVLRFPGAGTGAFYRLCRALPGVGRRVVKALAR